MKVRVGSIGTIVIPKEVRVKSGIREGDVLEVSVEEGTIILVKDRTWERLHGCAKGLTTVEDVERELDEDEGVWENRLEQ
ncbi:MAG: AbrB/MazE/SpoVT family DNA-binding domain-containing protein [Candidatus Bathyarchaeia archaeon]